MEKKTLFTPLPLFHDPRALRGPLWELSAVDGSAWALRDQSVVTQPQMQ